MEAQLPVGRVVRPVGVVEAVELGVHRQRPDLEQLAHAPPTGVVGILGRNGMGKTTLVRSIVGFTPPRCEQVFFKDHDITGWPSTRSVSLGLGLVPQGRRVFPSLTVLENLLEGGHRLVAWRWCRAEREPIRPAGAEDAVEHQGMELGRPILGNDNNDEPATCALKNCRASWSEPSITWPMMTPTLPLIRVVAVGHRRDRPFVLADHEPLITILGYRREDPRLPGAWAGEEMLDPPSFRVWSSRPGDSCRIWRKSG